MSIVLVLLTLFVIPIRSQAQCPTNVPGLNLPGCGWVLGQELINWEHTPGQTCQVLVKFCYRCCGGVMEHYISSYEFLNPTCGPLNGWNPTHYQHLGELADRSIADFLVGVYKDSECMANRLVPCDGECSPNNPSYPIVNIRYQAKCWQWTTYDPTNGLKKLAPCSNDIGCIVYYRMCYRQHSSTWFTACRVEAGRNYPENVPISCETNLPTSWDTNDCFAWCP
ncbi:MAG: hypothetical protein ACK6BZ_10240 [Candidatus Kapaibacterium sp.]